MKIIITGSLGHVGKPLTEELVGKGYTVTVISSKAEKREEIKELGATAAIGSLEDVDFLVSTFTGADAVYCMIPPNYTAPEPLEFYRKSAAIMLKPSSRRCQARGSSKQLGRTFGSGNRIYSRFS